MLRREALVNTDAADERIANVPSSPILVTLMMEETSVSTRATWFNIPEDDILRNHCRQNLKSYLSKNVCKSHLCLR
jgi:hypothetical protein